MTPKQQAEYRDSIARSRVALEDLRRTEQIERAAAAARVTRDAVEAARRSRAKPQPQSGSMMKRRRMPIPRPKRRSTLLILPPRSEPPAARRPATQAEAELAARLRPHLCPDSVVDLDRHALGVARMILQGRRR